MMILALFAGVLGCDEEAAESPDNNAQAGAGGQAGTNGDGDGDGDAGSGGIGGGGAGGQGGSSAHGGTGGGSQDGGPQLDGSYGGGGAGGAGGSDAGAFDAGPIGSITFTSLYDDVFSQQAFGTGLSCANDYCHGATGSGGFSVSTKQVAYDSLVSAEGSANCGGEIRVVPGNPDASLLVQKITDPTCGERMPKDNEDSLSPETVARIRAWISAGAMND
jgi:hypothetical protein